MACWTDDELPGLDLGDRRLTERVCLMLARMAEHPSGSIPETFATAAETKAAYRALWSESVDAGKIRAAAYEACGRRAQGRSLILAVQDTTHLEFAHEAAYVHEEGEAGPPVSGVWVHSVLAVTAEGVPLGLLHQQSWPRDPEAEGRRHQRRQRPLEEKESFR